QYVASHSAPQVAEAVAHEAVPVLVNLINRIASLFNVLVSEKFVLQSLPLLGAVTGASLNAAFADHFNNVARSHFGLRKLERRYGAEAVQREYQHQFLLRLRPEA